MRDRFDKAGIELSAYAMPINATFTDAEMERAFQIAKALRVPAINTQANIPLATRLASLAEKYGILIGLHPAGNSANPESIGSGASYARVFAISGRLRANLDQHLFRDWGPEPLDFVRQHHERISTVHFHDRRVLTEPHDWLPFGQGDTPVKEMQLLAKSQRYRFPFSIEVVYKTDDPAGEMRRQIDYCCRVLD